MAHIICNGTFKRFLGNMQQAVSPRSFSRGHCLLKVLMRLCSARCHSPRQAVGRGGGATGRDTASSPLSRHLTPSGRAPRRPREPATMAGATYGISHARRHHIQVQYGARATFAYGGHGPTKSQRPAGFYADKQVTNRNGFSSPSYGWSKRSARTPELALPGDRTVRTSSMICCRNLAG